MEHLRELSTLAGTGLSNDDDDRVALNGFDDFLFILNYGKRNHRVPREKAKRCNASDSACCSSIKLKEYRAAV